MFGQRGILVGMCVSVCGCAHIDARPAKVLDSFPVNWRTNIGQSSGLPVGQEFKVDVYCDPGMKITGGGFEDQLVNSGILVETSAPIVAGPDREGWSVVVKNVGPYEHSVSISVFVGCR